jgi:alcohol sulfotransferase
VKYALQAARQFSQTVRKKLSRRFLHLRMRGASEEETLAAERKLRGAEQMRKLSKADVVMVSFGKSGRTWLRVMLSHLFREMYGLPPRMILGFDNFHNLNRSIPKIFFTHDNYIKDLTGHSDNKQVFYNKRVVLMARDPRDVAVSQFFQWKFRMKPAKVLINKYPARDSDTDIFEFVTGGQGGSMQAVIEFMNVWARECGKIKDFHLLRYEDLRAGPNRELRRLLDFMNVQASDEQVNRAVEYAAFENMKNMEGKKQFRLAGGRMMPGDKNNPDSYKVRRAKVGGYRDYFSDEQVDAIDKQVADTLDPLFGYK